MDTSSTAFTPDLIDALRAPFPWDALAVRPGSVRRDGTGALALAFADPRVYEERLDDVAGPEHWSVEFAPWGNTRLICRLTLFGVVKCSTGEADPTDKNAGTVAEAQAFKRACAKFGVGRYLYHLPQVWARGTGDSKNFRFENPDRVIDEMRHTYELAHRKFRSAPTHAASTPVRTDLPPDSRRPAQPAPARPTTPEYAQKRATARAALEHAERRTGLAHERWPRS